MSQISACILSVSGPELTPDEAALFAAEQPWGVILMGRSCVSRGQVRKLVDDIWAALERPCLIFIDQEGGRVARLKAPEWPLFPPAAAYGALYQSDQKAGLEAAWLGHRLMAAELTQIGIHADCAPVVDLPAPGAHDVIGDRAFGNEPEAISALALAALNGLSDGGVAGVIKHIPGHGRSQTDSHLELPRVTASENELAQDFSAFAALCHAPMAMTAHISYESLDPGVAATLSAKVIDEVIRGRIGFDGLLMTDDLGMQALGGTLTSRAKAATEAGCDMLLHCSGFLTDAGDILAEMTEVAEAAPALTELSATRAARADAAATHAKPFDVDEGRDRFREYFPSLEAAA